ncbi:hypothetical protein N7462_003787 [Penicillium macrosclerotiorum]|uniref:uncharacterized protein n=1 Tax=Penicillium macrosclerotiorum TaxID=303699 RepID=UPI0025471230|nr:uncharacterized protein N7462_003787 [Penicillium macrosclerotiorum]KAJ5689395.1 hypothetical protein N7462_003787 [Penicillium macrosclerotiorum]
MPWQKVSQGRYERDFDTLEQFWIANAAVGAHINRQSYLLSCTVRLNPFPTAVEVQNSWKALRKEHPQIAAIADERNSRLTYNVPSPAELEAWVQRTFIVEDDGSSASGLYENLPPTSALELHYLPGTSELLFRTPHWRIDGHGLLHLQNSLLRIIAEGPPRTVCLDGSEAAHLVISQDEACSAPSKVTPSITAAADAELSTIFDGQPSLTLPTQPNIIAKAPGRLVSKISTETTQCLLSACKARGISVTTAAHAALIVAMVPYTQHNFDPATRGQGGGQLTGFNTISLRKYLPPPWNGPDAAVSVYHIGIPYTLDLGETNTFESIAAVLGSLYKRNFGEEDPRNIFAFLSEYLRKILTLFLMPAPDPLKEAAQADISSLGVLNDYLLCRHEGKNMTIEVEDWWISQEVIDRVLRTNIWTLNGRLAFSINWNMAFYEENFVTRFLHEWESIFLRELGVKS